MSMFLITLVSATNIGIFKQNTEMQITNFCSTGDCTYANLTSIILPSGTVNYINEFMTQTENDFNYTYTPTQIGTYTFKTCSNPEGASVCESDTFEVTYSGQIASSSQGIIYIILFGVMLFVFVMVIFFINKLPGMNTQDEEGKILSISYLKYLRSALWFVEYMVFVGILFLSSNIAFAYLGEQMFANLILTLFRIFFGLSIVILIVWIIWIIRNMFHDKEIQKLLNRGIFPQGKL